MPLEHIWRDTPLGLKKSVVGDLREIVDALLRSPFSIDEFFC
jgi:hypothetical protein